MPCRLTIDREMLSRLEALCRARICYTEVKTQLQELGIQYRPLSPGAKSSNSGSNVSTGSLENMIPVLRMEPSSISPGFTEGLFLFVAAKLTGWWDDQRETCNFIVQAKFAPEVIPSTMESGLLGRWTTHERSVSITKLIAPSELTDLIQLILPWCFVR